MKILLFIIWHKYDIMAFGHLSKNIEFQIVQMSRSENGNETDARLYCITWYYILYYQMATSSSNLFLTLLSSSRLPCDAKAICMFKCWWLIWIFNGLSEDLKSNQWWNREENNINISTVIYVINLLSKC